MDYEKKPNPYWRTPATEQRADMTALAQKVLRNEQERMKKAGRK